MSQYYLTFDCGTKTLAFCLIKLDLSILPKILETKDIQKIDELSKQIITFVGGNTIDLIPGKKDKEVHTIERIRALVLVLRGHIIPVLEKNGVQTNNLEVIVEYQMGPNSNTRGIAISLITFFSDYLVYFVGPSLKNKISFNEEGKYCNFIEKCKNQYTANKNQTKYNFDYLEKLFHSDIPPTNPPNLRSHIADAVLQVFGFKYYGCSIEKAIKMF